MNKRMGHVDSNSKKALRAFLDYFEIITVSIAIALVVFTFFFRLCYVDGNSMNNTLEDKQTLIISDTFYEPQTGDIIVFHPQNNNFKNPLVKRVIATGGQTVLIDVTEGTVSVDGIILNEDYIYLKGGEYNIAYFNYNELDYDENGHLVFSKTVPEGYLFVMGDNRNGSTDSRSQSVGFVNEKAVLGKVIFRLKPFTFY